MSDTPDTAAQEVDHLAALAEQVARLADVLHAAPEHVRTLLEHALRSEGAAPSLYGLGTLQAEEAAGARAPGRPHRNRATNRAAKAARRKNRGRK